jgi:hypothetical protein
VSAGPQASTLSAPEGGQDTLVTLRGNTRPEANAANDRGRVSDGLTLNHMMLQLQRTPEREQALQQFIRDIHDPASPLFHHWITAEEFGQRYGVAPADVARLTAWLESQGFKVNLVYPNQMVVDFTGSAGQIRQAFHTEIHNLLVKGHPHIANMSDPQIPADLASTVAGVVSLNDFRPHPTFVPRPNYTFTFDGTVYHEIVPADLWMIYNFNPVFAAGYSGQGQTIVVIEDTDVYSTDDWYTFRSVLGIASAYPLGTMTQVHPPSGSLNNCADPGVNGADEEATLDVEWASAGAPSAAIELASCSDTETNFGGFIALQNILNASGTPPAIISISYGESESALGAANNQSVSSLYQQAVTEGVTVFVSSGDSGAASSDDQDPYAEYGINVSGYTSTPYDVSVGGTDFADTYQGANDIYWNSTNNATNYGSALSYIPEIPWNSSCASVLFADFLGVEPTFGAGGLCNNTSDLNAYGLLNTAAGSGGPSACATGAPDIPGVVGGTCAGYAKPSWQSGLMGNPSDGVRDIPDVSLFAANGIWGHFYVECFSDPNNNGKSCSGAPSGWNGGGGTSFAAPIMAGIQALVNQASGSRWGNPNPAYYELAAEEYGSVGSTSCKSARGNAVGSNCIFYDVTQIPLVHGGTGTGGDSDVPCSGINCYAPSGTYGALSTAPQTLSSVSATNLGSGYTSAPTCTLSGGGGSGAACSASVTGVVATIDLTNGGFGYTTEPTCTLSGGGGTGATCAAMICANYEVCELAVTNFGSGYTSNPACTLGGGGGTGATCTATEVTGIAASLTAPGSGYTSLPHCVLSGGGGTGGTCAAMTDNTSTYYLRAFDAATGWDFTTGIGTVNVSNLVASFTTSASASLSPLSLSFPPLPIDESSTPLSVTVSNAGTANLVILSDAISGTNASDFAISADTCTGATLTASGTCTVSVTFTPSAEGSFSASLNITDIAPHSPQKVLLTGTGLGAGVGLSPSSLTFPEQIPGTSSPAQPVTLSNGGNVPLSVSIAITGTNSGDFAQTNNCGSSVPAGSLCAINVIFTPGAPGSRSATLTITDNALNSPQTVALTGIGASAVPVINQPLVPTSVTPGGQGFTFTVNGTGFVNGATINWNGTALATTFVSSQQLTATVPAANIALIGTAWITVGNPGSVVTSNMIPFLVTAPTPTAAFTKASGSPLAAGTDPVSIAVGDFNGDGKLDLAVANKGSNNLKILLGNGDSTFTPTSASPAAGATPYGLVVGDFNGDGKLDLAVANPGSNSVTILLGNGDGTFTPPSASPAAGTTPHELAVGDFNGDGKLDLAVANSGSNTVTILLGNGDGTFTPSAASPATGSLPFGIAVGDFNGDGKLDLAVTNQTDSTVTLLLGNGDGTFTPAATSPATGSSPSGIAVGDFNGDGKLDLAVVNSGSNTVTILLGNGDGTFTPSAASPATGSLPFGIAVGDFNGDGKLDLAVTNQTDSTVTLLLGNGDGTFTPAASSPATGAQPMGVAAGNFNGDGRLGLATANGGSNNVSVLIQFPMASVTPPSLSLGNQPVGTTSGASPVTVSNTGTAPLTFTGIAVTGDFAAAGGTTCSTSAPLAGDSNCVINVTFTPSATGGRSGNLTLTDNAGSSPQVVDLSGTGTAPTADLSTSSVSFGSQALETTSPAGAVTVTDNGTAPLTFTNIVVTGDFAVAASGTTCSTTAPVAAGGGSCVLDVTFTPTADGARSGSLTLIDNANSSPQTVSLSGTGTGPEVSLSSPLPFSAPSIGVTTSSQTVTLTNTGNSSLTFSAIAVTGPFAIVSSGTTCSTSAPVAATATCTVAITFTPTARGMSSGSLQFSDNAYNSPQTVALIGTVPDFALGPPSGSSTSATVAPGQPATYTLSMSGIGGFTGAVTFACTGAPAGATCTVWPVTATAANSATNITVTVSTTAPSLSAPRSGPLPQVPPLPPGLRVLLMLALVLGIMAWAIHRRNQPGSSPWRSAMLPLALGLLLALALAGCGSGGGGGGTSNVTPTPSNPVTPVGTSTLTVTGTAGAGSSALSHSVALMLTVS